MGGGAEQTGVCRLVCPFPTAGLMPASKVGRAPRATPRTLPSEVRPCSFCLDKSSPSPDVWALVRWVQGERCQGSPIKRGPARRHPRGPEAGAAGTSTPAPFWVSRSPAPLQICSQFSQTALPSKGRESWDCPPEAWAGQIPSATVTFPFLQAKLETGSQDPRSLHLSTRITAEKGKALTNDRVPLV